MLNESFIKGDHNASRKDNCHCPSAAVTLKSHHGQQDLLPSMTKYPPPPHYVPSGTVSHSVSQHMSILLHLVWLLVIVQEHITLIAKRSVVQKV